MLTVPSSEGVQVARYRLAGSDDRQPLLIAHATGFHGYCYVPVADALAERFDCHALDFRGHGRTNVDPAWAVDWNRFGDDALSVARTVAPNGGLVGFGHSMGAAALLMAAHRDAGLFERLVLFEPISHQATAPPLSRAEMETLPIVRGARRRTRRFESFDAAFENFSTKPPLSLMVPEALRDYVDHGFREIVDESGRAGVELRCRPELEADIFVTGRDNGVWSLLPGIETPCVVVGGHVEQSHPSVQTEAIADRLPHGRYLLLDDQTHFGPFSHPAVTARVIADG